MRTNITINKEEVKSKNTGSHTGIFFTNFIANRKKILQFEKNMLLVRHNIIESGVKSPAFLLEGIFDAPNAPVAKHA